MNIIKYLTTSFIAILITANPAYAEGQKLADKLENAAVVMEFKVDSCNADAAKLCPGLPLNSKKAFMCLAAYEDNLSTECKIGIVETAIAMELSMLAIEYSIDACEADADKFCLDVQPGEGRIVSCLKKNESKLQASCTAALKDTGLWDIAK